MATVAGRHRAAPVRRAGDVWEEITQDAAVALIGLLLAVLVTIGVAALWVLSPFAAVPAGVLAVVGLVALVHWMRKSTDA